MHAKVRVYPVTQASHVNINGLSLGFKPDILWISGLDLRGYKPAEVARTLRQRILILQGGRDYQVTLDDLKGWQDALQGRSNVEITVFPDLNHLFITGKGKSTPAEYNLPGHVAAPVIAGILEWMHSTEGK